MAVTPDEQRLIEAAGSGDLDEVEALLRRGVSPDPTTEHGHSALGLAAMRGHVAVVSRLLEFGADVGASDQGGLTILMSAAEFPRPEIVRKLIDAGADVNAVAVDGRTALLNSIWPADSTADVVEVLIEAGADVNIKDGNYGLSPRQWADKAGKTEASQLLADAERSPLSSD